MAHDVGVARTERSARLLAMRRFFARSWGLLPSRLQWQGWLAGTVWIILARSLEAATVGGAADLFAVRALFHEVPLPLIRRHTNIIVANRMRIVSGIVDMVQNRWLSPSVIREHLSHSSASRWVLEYLSMSQSRKQPSR